MFFLITVFFVGISTAGVKYVAVVETDVDASSGASDELKSAEVREITAELRRQATENLPRDKYNVMTSETVQSMGGAVLEECAEENCVIALGSQIGADYIVRGTISKFQTRFTLAIELYETENGTLVVSSEAVRSENLGELLDKAATASANMYKKFAGVKGAERESKAETEVIAKEFKSITTKKRKLDYYIAPKYQFPVGTPVSWGGVNVEGGLVWGNGVFLGLDLNFGMNDVSGWDFFNRDLGSTGRILAGVGISLGNVYNLLNQLQFVYGVSAGLWVAGAYPYTYKEYDNAGSITYNCLAPFIKLRWDFVELTYRGLLGWKDMTYGELGENRQRKEYPFDLSNHQLMLGLYFAINKREK
jgi:TolB-like protein